MTDRADIAADNFLAAPVPRAQLCPTRFYPVLAPHAKWLPPLIPQPVTRTRARGAVHARNLITPQRALL